MFRENYQQLNEFVIDTQSSKACRSCGLCKNQPPLLEKKNNANVFWVGLSAVKIPMNEDSVPLSIQTNTGSIINQIELNVKNSATFYKTNLVKCLPLSKDKIRYPKTSEMEQCYPFLQREINLFKPNIVFLLGKQVGSFILKKYGEHEPYFESSFKYTEYSFNNFTFFPIHHPSYIFVYKRKRILDYITAVSSLITMKINESGSQFHLTDQIRYDNSNYLEIKFPILI